MKAKLYVTAQVHENYNIDKNGFGETPYWKPKGGLQFVVEGVDVDTMIFASRDEVALALQDQLTKLSNIAEKFTYVDHELVISESKIELADFESSLEKVMNAER